MENPEEVLEDDADEDDDSEGGIDPTDHVRPVGLALLLLALDGTGAEKLGVFTETGSGSTSNRVFAWFSLKTGQGKGSESSTK